MVTTSCETLLTEIAKPKQRLSIIIKSDPFLCYWSEQILLNNWYNDSPKQRLRIQDNSAASHIEQHLLQVDLLQSKKTWIINCNKPGLCKDNKLDTIILKCLAQTDNQILIIFENINAGHQRGSWFKKLAASGLIITTKALSNYKVPLWLTQYSKHIAAPIAKPLAQTLCEQLNYHLPSLLQLCTQIQLQNIKPPYSLDKLNSCMLSTPDSGPVYDLLDYICSGNTQACTQAFNKNHPQQTLISLYWMLLRRLRQILHIHEQHKQLQQPLQQVLNQYNLWNKQQAVYSKCLRTPVKKLYQHYSKLCYLEWVLKGQYTGNFLLQLRQQCQQLCHCIHAN